MKILKGLFVVGLIGLGGFFLQASGSMGQKEYEDELRTKKARLEEYQDQVSGVEKEFIDMILNSEKKDKDLQISEVTNLDTGDSYKRVKAFDKANKIMIDARIPGIVFFRKGNDRCWIDTNKQTYFSEYFDYSKTDNYNSIISNEESMIYETFLSGREKSVEKIGDTYKITCLDELNKGSYRIYDLNGDCIESYTDNSQGRWSDKIISTSQDVDGYYNQLLELTNTYKQVGSIAEIKESGKE